VLPTNGEERGERKHPGNQLSVYFGGRNEKTNQGGEVSYQLHILLIFWMKQSRQWRPFGNLNGA
jgi:hypothetical protein